MKPTLSMNECWSSPLARGYLVIGLLSGVLLAITLTTRAAGMWAIIPPLVGVGGLLIRWQSAPVFVLLGTAIAVMLTKDLEFARPQFDNLLLASSLVVYSLSLCRLVGLTRSHWPPDPRPQLSRPTPQPRVKKSFRDLLLTVTLVYPIWRLLSHASTAPEGDLRQPETTSIDEIVVALIAPAFGLAAAFLIWRVATQLPVPLSADPQQWQLGIVIWAMAVAAIAVRIVIGFIAARRMSPDQARMALNDVVWLEHRRELHRIARGSVQKHPHKSVIMTKEENR